uniref:Zinc finger and Nuclear hormone receptor domain containing protein n=2 Tax=Haemonchus contortus TaxID=6289 RepID=W6N952_HAECO
MHSIDRCSKSILPTNSSAFEGRPDAMTQLSPEPFSEEDATARRVAVLTAPDAPKACKVCGDNANGYNFGVLTCESCKAFFRRNAIREEEIKCPFSSNCEITPASRRFCQACRLQKCFAAGMSKSWLSDQKPRAIPRKRAAVTDGEASSSEEVSVPKAYLNELIRKAKRRPAYCECKCTCGFYPPDTRLTAIESTKERQSSVVYPNNSLPSMTTSFGPSSFTRSEELNSPVPGPFSAVDTKTDLVRLTASHTRNQTDLTNGFPSPQGLLCIPGIGSNAMLSAFSTVQPTYTPLQSPIPPSPMLTISPMMQSLQPTDCAPSTSLKYATPSPGVAGDGKYAKLTAEDLQLVQELFRANEPLKAPLDFQFKDELTLMDIVKIIEAALKRIVCMARDLTAFQALDIEDKKNIMKGSCSELLILRGVMAFDPTKNTWNHNFSTGFKGMEVKLDLLKLVTESQHYEEHKKFLTEFHQQIRANECVMLLLMAIVIFRPDRHNLRDTHRIRDIQYMYYGVLRRVVECEYTGGEAVQIYEALVRKLEELKHLKEGLVEAFYGFDSRQLDPLIKELFDMI